MILFTIKSPFHLFIPALSVPSPKTVIAAFHIHVWEIKTNLAASPWRTLSCTEHCARCSTSGHLKQTNVTQSRVALRILAILWALGGLSCTLPWKPALLEFIIFPYEWRADELRRIFAPVVKTQAQRQQGVSMVVLSWPLTSTCYVRTPSNIPQCFTQLLKWGTLK